MNEGECLMLLNEWLKLNKQMHTWTDASIWAIFFNRGWCPKDAQ